MRQLNVYSKYVSNSVPSTKSYNFFFIVAPQYSGLKKYESIIREQGWRYVECPIVRESNQTKLF
ncbi:MAG: hypothetical protein JW891_18475 [Candidatus Lokiarchaeota archaeon]|nr:hypothetical protein [Candidatus Lokiarchaeota archaeon]